MVLNGVNHKTCELYSLTWSEFSSSMIAAAQNLRNENDFTDVTISAGGKIFTAHKLILSAASPLLMELLKNTRCQHPILMLAGVSAFDLEAILDFVYQGEINVNSEKLPSLLQAATFLDIRALSPDALVLNSLSSASVPSTISNPEVIPYDTDSPSCKGTEGTALTINATKIKEIETSFSQKRKRIKNLVEKQSQVKSDSTANKNAFLKKSNTTVIPSHEIISPSMPKLSMQTKLVKSDSKEVATDEKKIISDLPVKCKLCGVILRQSRNLRRHMDQKHSKLKQKYKNLIEKESVVYNKIYAVTADKTVILKNSDNELSKDSSTSVLLDFSDDSFNQLTEEILNYSKSEPTSKNSTFSGSLSVTNSNSVKNNNCLVDNIIPVSSRNSLSPMSSSSSLSTASSSSLSVCSSSASVNHSQPLTTLLEGDLCFQLATTSMAMTTSTTTKEQEKRVSSDSSSSIGNFMCTNLEDTCHTSNNVQELIALKEFENHLFSVCFCPVDNDND